MYRVFASGGSEGIAVAVEEAAKVEEVAKTEEEAETAGGKGEVRIESSIKAIDKLISDLKSGKVKLHNVSSDEQLKVAKALKEKAPLKTDGDVEIAI